MWNKSDDWVEINNKSEKTFRFNNYNDVVSFSNKVMQIAMDQDHHPEINIHYNFVKVRITDYEKGAVSEKCHRFMSEVNRINGTK
jgi:4a-hydroxytetrahydrobiopterin dehydratase